MKIEMYALCLLRFRDGRIVFETDELTSIKDAIEEGLQEQGFYTGDRKPRDGFEVYSLDPEKVKNYLNADVKINSAEIGYYHHRVIAYLRLDSAVDFSKLREVRYELKHLVDKMIEHVVQDQINELQIREEARVEFFYTYPLIVVGKRPKRSEAFPFSEETSSLCFDIVEPAWFLPSGKKHMMRISIPGAILYTQRKVGKDLLRDIINAIYQCCLYEKQSVDKRPFENVLDENLLVKLWTHITDYMGGRSIDVHIIKLTHLAYFLALLALLALILSIIVPWILRYLGDC